MAFPLSLVYISLCKLITIKWIIMMSIVLAHFVCLKCDCFFSFETCPFLFAFLLCCFCIQYKFWLSHWRWRWIEHSKNKIAYATTTAKNANCLFCGKNDLLLKVSLYACIFFMVVVVVVLILCFQFPLSCRYF